MKMASNCPICNAPAEFAPKPKIYAEGVITLVRCSNESCANHQYYMWIDTWELNASLARCPICGQIVKQASDYGADYEFLINIGCDNTSNCFMLIGEDSENLAQKWNKIVALLNKNAG